MKSTDDQVVAQANGVRQTLNCPDVVCSRAIEQNNTQPQAISKIDKRDVSSAYRIDKMDNGVPVPGSSDCSEDSSHKTIIHWDDGDPENPYNWSTVGTLILHRSISNLVRAKKYALL